MPSTTIHINDRLLSKIDHLVKEKGISRNRFIVEACEMALKNLSGEWPEDFFASELKERDLRLLKDAVSEMEKSILTLRRNRKHIVL